MHVPRRDEVRGLRRGRGEQQVDARVVGLDDLADQVGVHRRRADDVDDALAVEPEVEEHAVVAELEVAVDEADPPAEALERDRGVDRDRRRAHAALRAVVGVDAAHRRPADQRVARGEPRDQALHAGEQLRRVEGLDQVVVGARPQRAHLLLHVPLGREHDDRDVVAGALLGADLRRDGVAVDGLDLDVEQDQGRGVELPLAQAVGGVGGDHDVVPLLLEGVLEQSLDARVVVDDEDFPGQTLLPERGYRPARDALGPRRCRRPV